MDLVRPIERPDAYLELFAHLSDDLLALLFLLAEALLLSCEELLVASLSIFKAFRRANAKEGVSRLGT